MAPTPTVRELRIFISSTFRDMQAERDYLVRQVFPGIRKACQERQVAFTDIDLRWGLTREEAEQGQVVRICLEEVDRCRPYFISLLGERYGWSPLDADLEHKAELLERFPYLADSLRQGLSVTEMEILHGVLDNPGMTEHCFFYLRDPTLTDALAIQQNAAGDFTESQPEALAKLERLKARIRTSGLPVREGYDRLEQLGEWVRQDLLAVLDQRFPVDQTPSPLEAERLAHRAYARDRIAAYIPSPADLEVLDRHLASGGNAPLLVTGASGLGKSALLAYWVSQLREQRPDRFIIEHYAGISGDTDPVAVLRRIMAEIKARTGDSEEPPGKPDEVIRDFPLWLARVREQDPLILVIDGLNQLESREVNWLPDFWPAMVKPLFSVIPGDTLEKLREREWPISELQPLDQDRREALIRNWLAGYRKSLSTEQTQRLAAAPQTGNPLFLRSLLEELRIFGYFEQLDRRIETLLGAEDPRDLFGLVLERLETDFGPATIRAIMTAIWAARRGLTEEELVEVTQLNRMTLSSVLLAVDTHLARRGGLLTFFHDYLRQAVQLRYLDTETAQQESHRQLAGYFHQQPDISQRVAEELPWQWQEAEDWEALKDCISAIPMFEVLYERDANELLGYWLRLGDRYDPGVCYQKALEEWEKIIDVDPLYSATKINNLALFLSSECECHTFAGSLYRRALAIREKILGKGHADTASSMHNLASHLMDIGDYVAAEPLAREALLIRDNLFGNEYAETASSLNACALLAKCTGNYESAETIYRRALAIQEKALGINHPDAAITMSNLANLLTDRGCYKEAESLYRRALTIIEATFGTKHPYTAKATSNIGLLFLEQGSYSLAESALQRAYNVYEAILGKRHTDTASSLNNLAFLYWNQKNYVAAESLYRQALSIYENKLGDDHASTTSCLNNLGALLVDQGDYDAAEPLLRRTLENVEKIFGDFHPDFAGSMNNLASLLAKTGKIDEAEVLFRRALSIFEMTLGSSNISTVNCLESLAFLMESNKCDYDAAELLYQRALTANEALFGAESMNTSTCICKLARVYIKHGKINEAERLYRHALAIRSQILGQGHPKVQSIRNILLKLLDGPLSNRHKIWKQPDFMIALEYSKPLAIESSIYKIDATTLLLGAYVANRSEALYQPIPVLIENSNLITSLAHGRGIYIPDNPESIRDLKLAIDNDLKALLKEFEKSTLECLVDAILWRINHQDTGTTRE